MKYSSQKNKIIGLISLLGIMGVLLLVLKMNTSFFTGKWSTQEAYLLTNKEGEGILLIHGSKTSRKGKSSSAETSALRSITLSSKELSRPFIYKRGKTIALRQISSNTVWIETSGYFKPQSILGLELNTLKPKYDAYELLKEDERVRELVERVDINSENNNLRFYALNGRQYKYSISNKELSLLPLGTVTPSTFSHHSTICQPVLNKPTHIDGKLLLEPNWVCALHYNKHSFFPNEDNLICHKTLKGLDGQMLLSRISNNTFVWTISHSVLQQYVDLEYPIVKYAALYRGSIFAIVEENWAYPYYSSYRGGEVFLLEIEASNGVVKWSSQLF